jgi:proteasome beta subunit
MASQPRRVQHLLAGVGDEGPRLYSFDANGGALDQPFAADGTGGQTAYGALEAAYEDGIDRDAARRLAARAVRAATERDLASGNGLCLAVLDGSEPTVETFDDYDPASADASRS